MRRRVHASYELAAGASAAVRVRGGAGRNSIQGDVVCRRAGRDGRRRSPGATTGSKPGPGSRAQGHRSRPQPHPRRGMTLSSRRFFADGLSTCATSAAGASETDRIAAMAAELRKLGNGG